MPNDGFNSDGTRNLSSVLATSHTLFLAEDDTKFNDTEILIYSIDDVVVLFGVPLNSLKEIDEFTKDLEVGKYALWSKLTKETCSGIIDIICNRWDTLLSMQKSALIVDDSLSGKASPSDPIVQFVDINTKSTSYVGAAGASATDQPKVNSNFCPFVADLVFDGVNIFISRKVVKKDGISLIATFIGKPVMLDSYTSFMCNDSWGRSSFARCLIEVNSEADLVDVVTSGIPSLIEDDFTKETIRVEYEWRPLRYDLCKIFSHVHVQCPKKVASPPIVTTSNVVTPTVEKINDAFQTMGKKKKRKGKSKSTTGGQFAGPSVKQSFRYEPKVSTSAPKK
nr:zinc knuckle CX2CX4HX4C [Tanacetum cinerariifolium]